MRANIRLIARLDIKGTNLIKGVHLEGLRVIGPPEETARRYYQDGIDELIYMDVVASLYGRNHLAEVISRVARDVFIPMTVGGGVRGVADADQLLRAGADKVAVNTAALRRPELITEIASRFGSQCMVVSVEGKRLPDGRWECYTDNGRERTGREVVQWVTEAVDRGAGEVLLTSVDQEGTRRGFDVALTRAVTSAVRVPVIASGGMGQVEHIREVVEEGGADAVALADYLHFSRGTVKDVRSAALAMQLNVRYA